MTPQKKPCVHHHILIYHQTGQLDRQATSFLKSAIEQGATISVITRIELLGWRRHASASFKDSEALVARLHEQALVEKIVGHCIQLRKLYPIKLPDAIIAATALYKGLPLVTRNLRDFDLIHELKLINPFGFVKGIE